MLGSETKETSKSSCLLVGNIGFDSKGLQYGTGPKYET